MILLKKWHLNKNRALKQMQAIHLFEKNLVNL